MKKERCQLNKCVPLFLVIYVGSSSKIEKKYIIELKKNERKERKKESLPSQREIETAIQLRRKPEGVTLVSWHSVKNSPSPAMHDEIFNSEGYFIFLFNQLKSKNKQKQIICPGIEHKEISRVCHLLNTCCLSWVITFITYQTDCVHSFENRT